MPLTLIADIGGAEGDRTPDLMTASHALSQLSYGPVWFSASFPGLMSLQAMNDRGEQVLTQSAFACSLTAHCSLLTAHCSLLTAHCSLLIATATSRYKLWRARP